MKETEITIKVKLDDNNIPEQISWSAPDGGMIDESSKAMLLSFWDSKKKETLKMDLWTKEMPVDEMKTFTLQTFLSMKQSISKATGEENLVNLIEDFCIEFENKDLTTVQNLTKNQKQFISGWEATYQIMLLG